MIIKCWVCKEEKHVDYFYKDKSSKLGYQKACKMCQLERAKTYNEKTDYSKKYGKHRYREALKENENFNKERYEKNSDIFKKRRIEYLQTVSGRMSALLDSAKNRSKSKSNIICDITKQDLMNLYEKQMGVCALTGIPFELKKREGTKSRHYNPYSPSLDRITPEKGYVLENIRLVCTIVNLALNNFGDDVFDYMCESYLSTKLARQNQTVL